VSETTISRADFAASGGVVFDADGRRTWTLAVACLSVALVMSSMIALNSALSDIAVATSATQTQLTWVADSYPLVLACLLLPAGAIGVRCGRRCALLIGLGVFSVASLAPEFFESPVQIVASRAVAGVGAAFVMSATLSLLTALYPKDMRARAVGIWAGVGGSAAVVGSLGSILLLRFWAWQSLCWALAVTGLVLLVLVLTVSESRNDDATSVDKAGGALRGASVAIFVFGLIEAPARGWIDPVVYGCMAAGLVLVVVLGLVERRRRHPSRDARSSACTESSTSATIITVLLLATFGFFFVLTQYTQLVLGYSALQTASALTPVIAALIVLTAFSFWYLPKLDLRLVVFLGLAILAVGFLCLRRLGLDSACIEVAWPLLVLSIGIGLCTARGTSVIADAVPDHVTSAVNDTVRELGAVLGFAIAGSMLAVQYARNITPVVSAFSAPMRGPATSSLAQAIAVSDQLAPQRASLTDVSRIAFVEAMQSSLLVIAGIVAVAAVVIAVWAPGRRLSDR
jgi:MFS family permease